MKLKHTITFLLLIVLLMSFSYLILEAVEQQVNILLILSLTGLWITDLALMVKFFLRFMNSAPDNT